MAWKAYSFRAPLLSPLHAGWRTVGNLKQTRRYVPGRSIWGALAGRLARDRFREDYAAGRAWVGQYLRYSYWYVSDREGGLGLMPWADGFDWLHMGSHAGTALRDGRAKLDGSLHEVEYLASKTREGNQVWLHGVFFLDDAGGVSAGQLWERFQTGGERTYGWGRVGAAVVEECPGTFLWGGSWEWVVGAEGVRVRSVGGAAAAAVAHVAAEGLGGTVKGGLETVVGRVTSESGGFGRDFSVAEVCWSPGSRLGGEFEVGEFGIWRAPGNG